MTKARWELDPATTAVLVIDMQNAFLLPDSPLAARSGLDIVPAFNRVIAAARARGMPVIFTATTHDPAEPPNRMDDLFPGRRTTGSLAPSSPGWRLHPAIDFQEGDVLVAKPRYSAFWATNLEDVLRRRRIDTLVLGGVWSSVCVAATARDALFRDYKVVCLADCTATGDLPDTGHGDVKADDLQRVTLADLAWHVAEVATAEEVLERISHSRVRRS